MSICGGKNQIIYFPHALLKSFNQCVERESYWVLLCAFCREEEKDMRIKRNPLGFTSDPLLLSEHLGPGFAIYKQVIKLVLPKAVMESLKGRKFFANKNALPQECLLIINEKLKTRN